MPLVLLLSAASWAAPLDPMAFAILQPTLDPSGPVTVLTDGPTLSYGGVELHGVFAGDVAVFTFGDVVLDQPVQAEGTAAIAILSQGDLRVDAEIRVYARGSVAGPGGHSGGTAPGGQAGGGPGGGQATPGAGGGGFGGDGGDSERGGDRGVAYGDLAATLEGGSGGAKCNRVVNENGDGGGGGGAIELGAVGRLDVTANAQILADGGDGLTSAYNGGGGGSGGAIALHGRGGTCDGSLLARGGAGGDDGGALYAEGGGGGGGQIAMLDLDTACDTDVTGGRAPNVGQADDGIVTFRQWEDHDDDGDGYSVGDGDCDDDDASIHPGAYDTPGDGIDSDCDGVDAGDTGTTPGTTSGTGPTGTDGTTLDTATTGTDPGPTQGDPYAGEELLITSGCGCGGGGTTGGLAVVLGLGLVGIRRRL